MLAKQLCVLFATLVVPMLGAGASEPTVGGTSRWATFDASGTGYFAVSLQPDAGSSVPLPERHEVVLLVDTSASQTGPVRLEALEAIEELVVGLPANASVSLVACDVKAVPLTSGMVGPSSPEMAAAVAKLKQRVPLGTTNLSVALNTAVAQFGNAPSVQRSILYVGDGVNRKQYLSTDAQKALINNLITKQITINSFVIGPMVDVPTMAALANQTGGILLSRNELTASMQEVGRALAESLHVPVLWPAKVETPAALAKHLPAQFPPLRLDRDSVIIGQTQGKAEAGKLVVNAVVAGNKVTLRWNLSPENSHPDMAFLPSVYESALKDEGRTMPALGSAGLKAMSLVMSDSSVTLVKSGEFALKAGEIQSAIRIAEEALKSDPNNAEAQSLLDAAKKEAAKIPAGKFMRAQQDPFATEQPPAGGAADPFGLGTAPATPAPAAADPFGTEPAAPAAPAPAAVAPPAPAADVPLTPNTNDALAPLDSTTGVLDSRFFGPGELLEKEAEIRRVQSAAIATTVRAKINEANRLMTREPARAKNTLDALEEQLDQSVDLDPGLRRTLQNQVQGALQVAHERLVRWEEQQARNRTIEAASLEAERLLSASARNEAALKQLVEGFTDLMNQFRYLEASQEIAPEIEALAPATPLAAIAFNESSLMANQALVRDAFRRREQGFIDSMRGVEEAAVPFAGVPPIVYPPADVWAALSARRKERYGSINLAADEREQKIYAALSRPADADENSGVVEFQGLPLKQVIEQFKEKHGIDIILNEAEIDLAGASSDAPVTISLSGATLRSALRLILKPLSLTYVIREGVLQITSEDDADKDPSSKIYPVGDLVVPPMSMGGGMMGGMGGMGGGMGGMGGMGGGMGGMGMGGMGGGMGGMGMGGMGGGMGGMGGMFAVPDDVKKSPVAKPVATPVSTPAEKAPEASAKKSAQSWDDIVRQYATADEKAKKRLDAEVREMVTSLVTSAQKAVEAKDEKTAVGHFEQVISLVNQMLSSGHPQPWMYQALSLAMKACKYPQDEIERVMLSSLDFGGDTTAAIEIAEYFASIQMKREALSLLRDTAVVDPHSYELFALALPLARELNDVEALRWTCAGVLSKAWPTKYDKLVEDAKLAARATSLRLKQAGKIMEATTFENEIKEALRRDIIVRVTWTGDAEIALRVKEPAGTVCSYNNPITVSGGVLLNASTNSKKDALGGVSEYYVCPQGYAGEYDILLRRVWGKVSGGKATVEVLTDYGTPEENRIVQQIDINEKNALVRVAVKNGHRKEPIAAADLASIRERQLSTSRSVLAQMGNDASSSGGSFANNPYAMMQSLLASRANGFAFPIRGAVGYRPQIQTFPEGASLLVSGVVSADRRYVRISPSPAFTQIGEVFTFNFVSGQTAGGTGTTGGTGTGSTGGANGGFGNGAGGIQ